jgi:hypothetical protein
VPQVTWSEAESWAERAWLTVDLPEVAARAAAARFLRPGESAIMAESEYAFVTPFSELFSCYPISRGRQRHPGRRVQYDSTYYLRPRRSEEVNCETADGVSQRAHDRATVAPRLQHWPNADQAVGQNTASAPPAPQDLPRSRGHEVVIPAHTLDLRRTSPPSTPQSMAGVTAARPPPRTVRCCGAGQLAAIVEHDRLVDARGSRLPAREHAVKIGQRFVTARRADPSFRRTDEIPPCRRPGAGLGSRGD